MLGAFVVKERLVIHWLLESGVAYRQQTSKLPFATKPIMAMVGFRNVFLLL